MLPCTAQSHFDFSASVAAVADLRWGRYVMMRGQAEGATLLVQVDSPTRDVGSALDRGTDPWRFAGDVERLPGALVKAAPFDASPLPTGRVAAEWALSSSSMLATLSEAASSHTIVETADDALQDSRPASQFWLRPL